jgi:hypothetical protein
MPAEDLFARKYLTASHICALLGGISDRHLHNLIVSGEFPKHDLCHGRKRLWIAEKVAPVVAARRELVA